MNKQKDVLEKVYSWEIDGMNGKQIIKQTGNGLLEGLSWSKAAGCYTKERRQKFFDDIGFPYDCETGKIINNQ